MTQKGQIIGITIGLVSILFTLLAWLLPLNNGKTTIVTIPFEPSNVSKKFQPGVKKETQQKIEIDNSLHTKPALLVISGTGADVTIKKSSGTIPYQGSVISATGSNQVIYLPKGQLLTIKVTGTGVDISVASELLEQINIQDSGVGTDISEI